MVSFADNITSAIDCPDYIIYEGKRNMNAWFPYNRSQSSYTVSSDEGDFWKQSYEAKNKPNLSATELET